VPFDRDLELADGDDMGGVAASPRSNRIVACATLKGLFDFNLAKGSALDILCRLIR